MAVGVEVADADPNRLTCMIDIDYAEVLYSHALPFFVIDHRL